ncbi:MAG: NADH-quinone oxidoreductase subunit NuoF [Alphaproteobacteria bacterium]|nr:NADH-quinone oxidoreductase subunit NuoF [Alphaproteobacteria bacterium]
MSILLNQICFRTLDKEKPWTLATYEQADGYQAFKKILANKTPSQEIVEQLKLSSLRGRGGAGFPTGLKWSFISPSTPAPKYVVCNADEGEPGTFKDRDILRYNPHQLLEGILISCYVVGAADAYIYIRGEFYEPIARVAAALEEAQAAGYMGENILGSGFTCRIHFHVGAGAYICGEETALLESLEGKQGKPRFKPPFPANFGLYGRPTTINNVETFASVPLILTQGANWFLDLGKPNNGGYKVFSVSGHVNKPGNYEIPLGTPFSALLELAGGMRDGRKLKAVIPGGSSAPVIPGDMMMDLTMDYDCISKAGSMLGSGAVIVMDDTTCMVKVLARNAEFYHDESCGQCTPCREGTGWVARIVERIEHGHGTPEDLALVTDVAMKMVGRTICVLADSIALPVVSFMKYYRPEFEYHVEHKKCMVAEHD